MLDLDPDLDLRIDRVIRAPRTPGVEGVDRPARPRPLVAAGSDALPGRAPRRRAGRRVRHVDERGRHRLRPAPRRVLRGRRARRADRVHERARQPLAAGRPAPVAMTAEITFGDHPAGHRLPRRRPARRCRLADAPRTARLRRRLGHGHRAARRRRRSRGGTTMRLTLTQFVTLDGVYQGPGSPDEDTTDGFTRGGWMVPHMDQTFIAIAAGWLERAGALLLGRRTYEAFAMAWPQNTDPDDPFAERMNSLPKYVASHTITETPWTPATVLGGDVVAQVAELKAQPGDELQLHGSARLCAVAAGRRPDRRDPPRHHPHRPRSGPPALPRRRPGPRHAASPRPPRRRAASRSSCSRRPAPPPSPPTKASARSTPEAQLREPLKPIAFARDRSDWPGGHARWPTDEERRHGDISDRPRSAATRRCGLARFASLGRARCAVSRVDGRRHRRNDRQHRVADPGA